jgi:hypothetical protein
MLELGTWHAEILYSSCNCQLLGISFLCGIVRILQGATIIGLGLPEHRTEPRSRSKVFNPQARVRKHVCASRPGPAGTTSLSTLEHNTACQPPILQKMRFAYSLIPEIPQYCQSNHEKTNNGERQNPTRPCII